MQLWVLLITALVPLAIAPGLVSAFDITPKIAILLFCESALLVFCKNFVSASRALIQSRAGKAFAALLVGRLASMILSIFWSTNVSLSVYGSGWRRDGLIVDSAILIFTWMVAVWLAEDAGHTRALLRVATGAGAIGAIYGIVQYFGWDPLLPSVAYQSGEGPFTIVRPPGTLGHADYFADWLVMIVFLALYLVKLEDDGIARGFARIAALLATFAIVLSGTRSALAGLAVGVVVFFAISRPKVNWRGLLAAATCIAGLAVLYVSPAGAKLRARVHWSMDDVYGGARVLLWKDSLQMAKEHALLGYGPETFTTQFPAFQSVALAKAYPDSYQESPHNMFLDVLTSRGGLGLAILIGLCTVALWCARRNGALAGALVGAMVCQQFMVLTVPTALYFYLLMALAVASRSVTAKDSVKSERPVVQMIFACTLALVLVVFATRLIVADGAMALAEKRIAAGDVEGATKSYLTAQRWESSAGDRDLNYSRAMARLVGSTTGLAKSAAAAQQATDAAVRATQTAEDRQNAWYNLATIAALRNDRNGVEDALRHAIAFAPHWFKPHWTLAQFLELTGRHGEARPEAAIALELDGGHDSEVTETCGKILSYP